MMGSRCSHHLGEVLSKKDAKAKGSVDLGETTGGVPNGKTGVSARVLRPKNSLASWSNSGGGWTGMKGGLAGGNCLKVATVGWGEGLLRRVTHGWRA
eukprot:3143222-Rhodomonas_salina.1